MSVKFLPLPHGVTWTHFRVVRTSPDGFQAQTGYRIAASYRTTGSGSEVSISQAAVTVSLVSAQTWVVAGTKTAALLDHERLHYVIATLVGRELDRELASLTGPNTATVLQAADDLVAAKTDRALAIGSAYDDDTNHGEDVGQQRLWQGRVHGWEVDGNRVSWS
ncbi:MAG TPA: DUF922 domain-containing protein [Polyangia bacterium]|nr:DUF922 domain-containing protein [Polyangia bacterium]